MAFMSSSRESSMTSDHNMEDENQRFIQQPHSDNDKPKCLAALHRAFSTPSGTGSTSSCLSRLSERNSRSFTCPSRASYSSYRSLRGSSPSHSELNSPRNSLKASRINTNISASVDLPCKPTESFGQNLRLPSISSSNNSNLESSPTRDDMVRLLRYRTCPFDHPTVARSRSIPPRSPGRIVYSSSSRSESDPAENSPASQGLTSMSYPDGFNLQRERMTSTDRITSSMESLDPVSRESIRRMSDQVSSNVSYEIVTTPDVPQDVRINWWGFNPNQMDLRTYHPGLEQPNDQSLLSFPPVHRGLDKMHFQSPPPSYEILCNPESLPTYHDAVNRYSKRQERGLYSGLSARYSPNLDLSDSETDCDLILEAIPRHPVSDAGHQVPITFTSRFSLRHIQCGRRKCRFFSPVCARELIRTELNSRWPFIVCAKEDDRFPGLLFVECSSNLTMAHLPESQSTTDDVMQTLVPNEGPYSGTSTEDVESTALNNHIMFYMCGKCVCFDSFDAHSVKDHLKHECTGTMEKVRTISELCLVVRAVFFVLVMIMILMWLPLHKW